MALYDDEYDDDFDDDEAQDVDFDQAEDSDDGTPDTSTNEGLLQSICQLLNLKFHLQLPDDCTEETLLRDLHVALHAHPGIELIDDQGGMDDVDALQEEPEAGEEQLGYGQSGLGRNSYKGPGRGRMPSNSKPRKLSATRRPATEITPAGQRMSEERSVRVLAEALHNGGMSEAEHDQVKRARQLSHGRPRVSLSRCAEAAAEIRRNAGLE